MLDEEKAAISRGVMCLLGDQSGDVLEGNGSLVDYIVRQIVKYGGLRSNSAF